MNSRSAMRNAIEVVHHIQDPNPPWNDVLSASRAVVGSDGATLLMFSGERQLLLMHQQGLDAAAESEYRQYYHRHDALAKAALP